MSIDDTNVIPLFPKSAPASIDWPPTDNIHQAFSVGLVAMSYWANTLYQAPMPVIRLGRAAMTLLQVFEAASTLDEELPVVDRAIFIGIHLTAPQTPPFTTYRQGASQCALAVRECLTAPPVATPFAPAPATDDCGRRVSYEVVETAPGLWSVVEIIGFFGNERALVRPHGGQFPSAAAAEINRHRILHPDPDAPIRWSSKFTTEEAAILQAAESEALRLLQIEAIKWNAKRVQREATPDDDGPAAA